MPRYSISLMTRSSFTDDKKSGVLIPDILRHWAGSLYFGLYVLIWFYNYFIRKPYRNDSCNLGGVNMTLKDKLYKLKESFKTRAPQDALEIMHRATEDLKNSDIMDHVVKEGDNAPDFRLKNTKGQNLSLHALLCDGPVVLTFYRGNW
jgi:hypothetical protein